MLGKLLGQSPAWRVGQKPEPTRPEAVRQLVAKGLEG